ncbi:site-specific integrase [Pseudolactococcus yaeyamensis]
MYNKKLASGKYKFFEKYQDIDGKWKQVSCTMNSASRDSKSQDRNTLELKIKEKLEQSKPSVKPKTVNEVYAESAKIRKAEVAETTFLNETYGLKSFIETFGKRKISTIEAHEIQEYLFAKKYTNATRNTLKQRISHVFKYAYQMDITESNIMDKIILPKNKRSIESIAKLQHKFLTLDEMRILLASMRKNAYDSDQFLFADCVEFLFLTGLRIGELMALQWSHVNLLDETIYIEFSWNANLKKLGPTKNPQSIRFVTLNHRCLEILEALHKHNSDSKFVFTKSNGYQVSNMALNLYLKMEGARANLFGKDSSLFSCHMLRHSHISHMALLGVPQKALMERVGHSDSRITNNIYTHVMPESRQEMNLKLNDIIV